MKFYVAKDKADLIALFTDAAVMKHVGEGVLTEAQAESWRLKLFEKQTPGDFRFIQSRRKPARN